jgi:hypothetical protein
MIMKHIKIFKDQTIITRSENGLTVCSTIWAQDEAEEFINRGDVDVLTMSYAGGQDNAIMVVYREVDWV